MVSQDPKILFNFQLDASTVLAIDKAAAPISFHIVFINLLENSRWEFPMFLLNSTIRDKYKKNVSIHAPTATTRLNRKDNENKWFCYSKDPNH